jgi:WD40 repeat protein
MGRKLVIAVIVVLVSFLAVLGWFIRQGRISFLTDPWKAVPSDAAIIIETSDLQSFLNLVSADKGLFGEAAKINELKDLSAKTRFLAGQLARPTLKKLNGSHTVVSFHVTRQGKLKPLMAMALPADISAGRIKDMLKGSGITSIGGSGARRSPVYSIPYSSASGTDTAWLSYRKGILLCSSSATLVRRALAQVEAEGDIRNTRGFSKILLASGKNSDRIFIVFGNLKGLFDKAFSEGSLALAAKAGKLADCVEGDLFINENGITLSGYTETSDPSQSLFRYKTMNPGLMQTYKILPAATALFETIITGDLKKPKIESTASPETVALADTLRKYMGNEVTKAFIDDRDQPAAGSSLVIYRLKDRSFAEKLFLDAFSPLVTKDNVLYFHPDEVVNVPVFSTPYKGFASEIIPGLAPGFDDTYFTFYDNYLITGSSYATVSRLLYDNLLNKTLANDIGYRDFESTLPSIAGYFFYCVPSRLAGYLAPTLSDDMNNAIRNGRGSLAKVQAVGFRMTQSNTMLYNSLSVKFRDEVREESNAEWQTLLDTTAAIKPFFFTNHLTGAKEIFIQDLSNNCYLINAAGRVLWKVPLREKISGAVYMIDYFRNGKYQLLFAGKNYIHLLDRNGNYVERYPVKLRSPATNTLSLFDYDNNRDYRLLIAGEDKLVYAYDSEGGIVKGWTPFRTNEKVTSPVNWFRVSGKDYLVVADETSLYFIDRQGKPKLTLKEPVTVAANSAIRLVPGRDPCLVCSSPDGTVMNIFFDGSVRRFSLVKVSGDHSFDIFDVNGDGFGEYIFIDRGILYLYNHNRTEVFTRQFGSKDLGGPISFIFSADERKIGLFDIDRNQIYLIDGEGRTMAGFPLTGASMFSIGKLSDKSGWHLIVGGTDRFLYNYKLNTETN